MHSRLDSVIISVAERFRAQYELVMTVPTVKVHSAISIIAEIGVDMSVFPTAKQLCSWTVLTPRTMRALARKTYPYQSCRGLHQAFAGSMRHSRCPFREAPQNQKSLSSL